MVAKAGALTFAQLESLWIQAGGPSKLAPLMAAVALAESSGIPTETNPTDNHGTQTSWGLWQISTGTHAEPNPNWADPLENAKLAVAKWHTQGLWAWGTYTSGKYKEFLPKGYVAPDPNLGSLAGTVATEGGQGIAGVQPSGNQEGAWTSALGGAWSDVNNGLFSWPGVLLGAIDDFDKAVGAAYDGAKLFFQPSTYVRIGAGIGGVVCLIAALVFMVRGASEK